MCVHSHSYTASQHSTHNTTRTRILKFLMTAECHSYQVISLFLEIGNFKPNATCPKAGGETALRLLTRHDSLRRPRVNSPRPVCSIGRQCHQDELPKRLTPSEFCASGLGVPVVPTKHATTLHTEPHFLPVMPSQEALRTGSCRVGPGTLGGLGSCSKRRGVPSGIRRAQPQPSPPFPLRRAPRRFHAQRS